MYRIQPEATVFQGHCWLSFLRRDGERATFGIPWMSPVPTGHGLTRRDPLGCTHHHHRTQHAYDSFQPRSSTSLVIAKRGTVAFVSSCLVKRRRSREDTWEEPWRVGWALPGDRLARKQAHPRTGAFSIFFLSHSFSLLTASHPIRVTLTAYTR